MILLYIWHDNRYWSKILISTVHTTAYDLEGKVMDLFLEKFMLKFCVKVFKISYFC